MSRIKREAFGNKHGYQSEISNFKLSILRERLKRRLKFWKWLFQGKWQRLRVFFLSLSFFLCYLQFDILKRFVADGASSLALLLVLLVLVYGSTVLRGYKHKEEKARETEAARNRDSLGSHNSVPHCDRLRLYKLHPRERWYVTRPGVGRITWSRIARGASANGEWRDKWTPRLFLNY